MLVQTIKDNNIDSKSKLLEKWKIQPKFLLSAMSLWVDRSNHKFLTEMWPPVNDGLVVTILANIMDWFILGQQLCETQEWKCWDWWRVSRKTFLVGEWWGLFLVRWVSSEFQTCKKQLWWNSSSSLLKILIRAIENIYNNELQRFGPRFERVWNSNASFRTFQIASILVKEIKLFHLSIQIQAESHILHLHQFVQSAHTCTS